MEQLVSVVIPSYNRAHLLEKTIPSYLQPEVGELIIIDDGSKDNTEEVIKSLQKGDSRIKYFKMPKNSGQTEAKNKGIELASYPYIYFGDDDSFIVEGTIRELLNCCINENYSIVGARALYMLDDETVEDTLNRYSKINKPLIDINNLKANFGINLSEPVEVPFVQACLLIKSEIAKKIKFDPIFNGSGYREETDFILRCAENGAKILFCPKGIQINLPRSQASGGAWSHGLLKYEISTIKNNWIFLKRHYKYLSKYWGLKTPLFILHLLFIRERLIFTIKKITKIMFGIENYNKIKKLFKDKRCNVK